MAEDKLVNSAKFNILIQISRKVFGSASYYFTWRGPSHLQKTSRQLDILSIAKPMSALQKEENYKDNAIINSTNLSAAWTTHATSKLLKLYQEKLEMLETPKKKTRIWIAISDNLKDYKINVTPDQVRWKINALTRKYKRCIDMGKHDKFKYFKELDVIYAKYNVDCNSYSISESSKKRCNHELTEDSTSTKLGLESRVIIDMRKARLARRIHCDISQGKLKLERQWLQYLQREEEHRLWQDNIFDKNLKVQEKQLETRKKGLEVKETFEYRNLQLMEKELNDLIAVEQEKHELFKQMFQRGDVPVLPHALN